MSESIRNDLSDQLPNELLLRIFGYFSLTDFIAARTVCRRWRALAPFTHMGDTRSAMLKFLDELRLSPWFVKTRAWVRANLRLFDRQAYISELLRQYPSLPDAFQMWVLEWPEQAAIGGLWPGLPLKDYFAPFADKMNVMEGTNWLSFPQVSLMTYMDHSRQMVEHVSGILVWESELCSIWIVVDDREDLRINGKVFRSGMCKSDIFLESSFEVVKLRHEYDSLEADWITFLRKIWKTIEAEGEHRLTMGLSMWPDNLEGIPVNSSPSAIPDTSEIRKTAWLRRAEPRCQERLLFLKEVYFH